MGSLDNRTDRWLGWVPLVKAARAYYIQEWVEFILSDTPRAQTCVHALALSTGGARTRAPRYPSELVVTWSGGLPVDYGGERAWGKNTVILRRDGLGCLRCGGSIPP